MTDANIKKATMADANIRKATMADAIIKKATIADANIKKTTMANAIIKNGTTAYANIEKGNDGIYRNITVFILYIQSGYFSINVEFTRQRDNGKTTTICMGQSK